MDRRWRFMLFEQCSALPTRWHIPPRLRLPAAPPPAELAASALTAAARVLARRGAGPRAWAADYGQNPVPFLLDGVDSPVRLWSAQTGLVYQDAATTDWPGLRHVGPPDAQPTTAEVEGLGLRRRVLPFRHGVDVFELEVLASRPGVSR